MSSTSRWPQSMASMAIPQFRWLFAGNLTLFFVVMGQMVTRTFLAWDLTHSEAALAHVSIAVAVPMLFASVVSGAVVDRFNKRTVILVGQSILLSLEMIVLVLLIFDALQFWHLLCVAFVIGCTFPFISPARMAITFDVVGARSFSNAMALTSGVINLSRVGGPAVIGLVLDIFDVRVAYGLAVVLHLVALMCVLPIRAKAPQSSAGRALFSEVAAGFGYVWTNRAIFICVCFGLLPMLLAMPVQNLFVVFSDQVWQAGERGFGLMIAASGVGGLIGSVWVAGRGDRPNRLKVMVASVLVFSLMMILFSLSPVFSLALVALIFANIFVSAAQTINNTVALLLSESEMKGRVSSLMNMSFGLTPLGVLPLAYAAEAVGVSYAVVIACLVLIILVVGFYLMSSTLRNMDQHVLESRKVTRAEPVERSEQSVLP